jgi:inner membrane protein
MDPLTHGLLGATIAQAGFGRRLGWRGVAAGATAAMVPDLDIVMNVTGPMGEWLYHRSITHALWFAPALAMLLGHLIARGRAEPAGGRPPLAPSEGGGWRRTWTLLLLLTLLSHPLLDCCTSYGTQLLAPFSNHRFAIDAVAIIDPAYSLALLAALAAGAWRGVRSAGARSAAGAVLALTTAYLLYGLGLNGAAEARARAELAAEGVRATEVRAYPTLLQLYLRRIVARDGDEVRVGWLSLWSPRTIEWQRFTAARDPLVTAARETDAGRLLEWFAMGQTAAALHGSTRGTVVEIDDLRYGFPSRPREGLWGIRVRFDAAGRLEGRPERIDRPLPASVRALVGQILRETFRPRP